jgi:hypothetical protein
MNDRGGARGRVTKEGSPRQKRIKTNRQRHPLRSCVEAPGSLTAGGAGTNPSACKYIRNPQNSLVEILRQRSVHKPVQISVSTSGEKTVVENGDTTVAFPARDRERTVSVVIERESAGIVTVE